ncbi:MAG: tripartite tricarboxylate transporter substrate binding protein [Betaproteobacteria bacterium]|nr:tripartite tricarboxylate transporter substrate binding protein [Betaproteobacteria bacterium]
MNAIASIHRRALALAAVCALAIASPVAQGQGVWPNKMVRIIVGFPGGSTPDIAARALADGLAKVWGQPVVVEAKTGAGGNLAADFVAKATDDHTLGVVINGNLTTAKLLNPKLTYDPVKDLLPLSLVATAPLVLVAPADQAGGAAWVAAARNAGDKWSYGSVGVGSVGHLGVEVIKAAVGNTGAVHVPYNGNPAVITAMLGGQVQMALMPPGVALPQVKAGKLQAVGLAGPRSPLAPDVPSLTEAGVRMNPLEVWTALVGPAGLSKAAQERIARDITALLKEADTRQRLITGGWDPQGTSGAVLATRVREETRIFGDIITARGIKLE